MPLPNPYERLGVKPPDWTQPNPFGSQIKYPRFPQPNSSPTPPPPPVTGRYQERIDEQKRRDEESARNAAKEAETQRQRQASQNQSAISQLGQVISDATRMLNDANQSRAFGGIGQVKSTPPQANENGGNFHVGLEAEYPK